jgi:ABC-2 type transport system permease protein
MIIVPFALFMGIFFGIGSDTGKDIPVMALGIAIGTILCHCAVEMIYEFDIRAVFKDKRSIIYCGVAACAIFAVFSMDVFGYDKYVPANDKLDHAAIFISYNNTYAGSSYDEDWNYVDDNDRVFDKMEVKKTEVITDIAKENMTHENSDSDTSTPGQADLNSTNAQASVCYTLKNGKKVYRKFNIDYGKNEELLNKLFADSNYKKEMININSPNIENNIKDMSLGYSNGVTFKDAKLDAEDVINSYKADYNAMTFSDVYGKLPVGYIELKYDISKYSSRVFDYPVYEGYSSTIEKLKAAGIDIESYIVPDDIERVEVSNYNYTDEDTEKGYNNGTEKTYEDKDATEAIREALTPSDLVTYSYACGNMFYDSCDASVYLKSNKSKFDWAPVSCVLEKDKTPDFVKADLHLGESDQSQNATISNNESEPEAFVEEVTQAK